jgi:ubiquinone/menaquinone biosynthesis C-methylase UbiE
MTRFTVVRKRNHGLPGKGSSPYESRYTTRAAECTETDKEAVKEDKVIPYVWRVVRKQKYSMVVNETIQQKARNPWCLETRASENEASQEVDFGKWVFDRIDVKAEARILELCCGTGLQTVQFSKRVGKKGHIIALDISREALKKLALKVSSNRTSKMSLINSDINALDKGLKKLNLTLPSFDLIFCAYGLYYSSDAKKTLDEAKKWLKPNGVIAIVGPYAANNGRLFEVLELSGVKIMDEVKYSSQRFMDYEVIPWAVEHFDKVVIDTMVNRVKWSSTDQIMRYWDNTTFYQKDRAKEVCSRLEAVFRKDGSFVNEKWVMMVRMYNAKM